jgi:hypothetical protein
MASTGFNSSTDSSSVIILKNNELKITYYSIISGTSGTITPPSQASFNTNEFGLSGNAILSEIDVNNKPTFQSPQTSGGTIVTASLDDVTGDWIASGVYTSASVALIYSLKIKTFYYSNLNYFYIIQSEALENINFLILRSQGSDGHRWKFTVDDTGMLSQPAEDLGV